MGLSRSCCFCLLIQVRSSAGLSPRVSRGRWPSRRCRMSTCCRSARSHCPGRRPSGGQRGQRGATTAPRGRAGTWREGEVLPGRGSGGEPSVWTLPTAADRYRDPTPCSAGRPSGDDVGTRSRVRHRDGGRDAGVGERVLCADGCGRWPQRCTCWGRRCPRLAASWRPRWTPVRGRVPERAVAGLSTGPPTGGWRLRTGPKRVPHPG